MQQSPSWRHTVHSYLRALLICDTENWCFCSCLIDTDSAWNSKCDICPCLSVCPPLSLSPTHTHVSLSCPRVTVSLSVWTIIPDFHGLLRPANFALPDLHCSALQQPVWHTNTIITTRVYHRLGPGT